jgi:Zn-dependent oligopeptidase
MKSFAALLPEDLPAELDFHLAAADEEVARAITAAGDAAAVLGHLDRVARHGRVAYGRTATLWTVHPDEAMRDASGKALTRYEQWRSSVFARPDLYAVLVELDAEPLSAPDARRLDLWRMSARGSGAHLDPAGRAALKLLQGRTSELTVQIEQAFVNDTPTLDLTDEELDGLPAEDLARLEPGEVAGTRRIRVEYATNDVVLENIRRRDVRERFWRALQDRALVTNLEAMRELFDKRRQIAHLAGFGSWADVRSSAGALGSVNAATAMLTELEGPTTRAVRAWVSACEAVLADELGGQPLQPWDLKRATRALQRRVGSDPEMLAEYLTLDAVSEGMFRLAREIFGVRVEPREGGRGWHEDVRTLALIDDVTDEELGICLWDPWARHGKMAGTVAFMDLLEADPPGPDGVFPPALTMLVTMVPKPEDDKPARIGVYEAGVLFHEFGHVLDMTFGSRKGATLDDGWWGSDWVEGPSFFLEFWGRSSSVFATYARHPQTGEPAPAGAVAALGHAQAIADVPYVARYLALGRLDLAVHGPDEVDLDAAWRAAHAVVPLPEPIGAFRPLPMSMIAGGYDAALYGVDYALEIRDELLAVADHEGALSPAFGRRYIDEVLRPGPFVPPTDRLAAFLGRPVSSASLIARLERGVEAARQGAEAGDDS